MFDYESRFNNIDVNEQVSPFNETIINIVPNFVPSDIITYDDWDPPWMNRYIKNLIIAKNNFYRSFVLTTNITYHHFTFRNLKTN